MNTLLQRACAIALLWPLLAASGFVFWISAAEQAGAAPPRLAANIAEAAAMGSAADVLTFLRTGDDPREVYPLRPEMISSAVLRATALEAAMWSRQLELVQLLDREGEPEARRALACLAADLRLEDVVEYLAPEGASACVQGEALARVVARTRGDGSSHD